MSKKNPEYEADISMTETSELDQTILPKSSENTEILEVSGKTAKKVNSDLALFEWLLYRDMSNEKSIFCGFSRVEFLKKTREYDAKVQLTDGTIYYVKVVTMNNVLKPHKVTSWRFEVGDDVLMPSDEEAQKTSAVEHRVIQDKIREMSLNNREHLEEVFVAKHEVDFDKTYHTNTGYLLNSLIRTVKNVWSKNYLPNRKRENSILVVIDQSPNAFYYKFDKTEFPNHQVNQTFGMDNLETFNSLSLAKDQVLDDNAKPHADILLSLEKDHPWEISDFFSSILFATIKELGVNDFFDEIAVYFHQAPTDNLNECFYPISTREGSRFVLENPIHNQKLEILTLVDHYQYFIDKINESKIEVLSSENSFYENYLVRKLGEI